MERESMLMYRSTREMLMDLKQENKEQYITALEMYMNYAFDGTEPDINGMPLILKLFWKAAKPLIDANNRNYSNGCKGGAPKGNKNNSTGKNQYSNKRTTEGQPKDNRKQTQGQRNDNDNVNDNDKDKDKVKDNANDNVNVNDNDNDNKKNNNFIPDDELPEGVIILEDGTRDWSNVPRDWSE